MQNLPVAAESSVATASVSTRPTDRQCAILWYGQVEASIYIWLCGGLGVRYPIKTSQLPGGLNSSTSVNIHLKLHFRLQELSSFVTIQHTPNMANVSLYMVNSILSIYTTVVSKTRLKSLVAPAVTLLVFCPLTKRCYRRTDVWYVKKILFCTVTKHN